MSDLDYLAGTLFVHERLLIQITRDLIRSGVAVDINFSELGSQRPSFDSNHPEFTTGFSETLANIRKAVFS